MPDTGSSVTLRKADGATSMSVCPGQAMTITVNFGRQGTPGEPEPRRALITLSAGTFQPTNNAANIVRDRRCDNRAYLSTEYMDYTAAYTHGFTVPCGASGQVQFVVVSSHCEIVDCGPVESSLFELYVTADVDPSPPPPSGDNPVPAPGSVVTTPAGSINGSVDAQGCTGTPTSLGYDCSIVLKDEAILHWSLAAAPPLNACTRQGGGSGVDGPTLMHFAMTAPVLGYVSFGFSAVPGLMFPGDLVLGWVDAEGTPFVAAFDAVDYDLNMAKARLPGANGNWAMHMGVSQARTGSDVTTTVCFSRALTDSRASATQVISPSAVAYQWATYDRPLLRQHNPEDYGSGVLDATGEGNGTSVAFVTAGMPAWVPNIHGAFMFLAWVVMSPAAVMCAAHKWAFGGAKAFGGDAWLQAHILLQSSAMLFFFVGLIVAFAEFPRPTTALPTAHAALAYATIAMLGLQLIFAIVRPKPGPGGWRPYWESLHHSLGRYTIVIALVTVATGIALYDTGPYGPTNVVGWVVPMALWLGALAFLDMFLKGKKTKADGYAAVAVAAKDGGGSSDGSDDGGAFVGKGGKADPREVDPEACEPGVVYVVTGADHDETPPRGDKESDPTSILSPNAPSSGSGGSGRAPSARGRFSGSSSGGGFPATRGFASTRSYAGALPGGSGGSSMVVAGGNLRSYASAQEGPLAAYAATSAAAIVANDAAAAAAAASSAEYETENNNNEDVQPVDLHGDGAHPPDAWHRPIAESPFAVPHAGQQVQQQADQQEEHADEKQEHADEHEEREQQLREQQQLHEQQQLQQLQQQQLLQQQLQQQQLLQHELQQQLQLQQQRLQHQHQLHEQQQLHDQQQLHEQQLHEQLLHEEERKQQLHEQRRLVEEHAKSSTLTRLLSSPMLSQQPQEQHAPEYSDASYAMVTSPPQQAHEPQRKPQQPEQLELAGLSSGSGSESDFRSGAPAPPSPAPPPPVVVIRQVSSAAASAGWPLARAGSSAHQEPAAWPPTRGASKRVQAASPTTQGTAAGASMPALPAAVSASIASPGDAAEGS
ncbi:hypothetical protein FOA52_001117 [Chlamydomonas sp. UWO 241]|nr:hypothetical protein FOA52_001117 [Chlamydomonas sp. UWO 241]